jgi:hypothetical protein
MVFQANFYTEKEKKQRVHVRTITWKFTVLKT